MLSGKVSCWLKLKSNPNQGLYLFRQKQILRSSRQKNLKTKIMKIFLENITEFIE